MAQRRHDVSRKFPFYKNWHKLAVHSAFTQGASHDNVAIPGEEWWDNTYQAGVARFYNK